MGEQRRGEFRGTGKSTRLATKTFRIGVIFGVEDILRGRRKEAVIRVRVK
jgi:hypothetical protein